MIDDPAISRRHAHVRMTLDGAEIVPLGRTPLDINGESTPRTRALAEGDELRFPGLTLVVQLRDEPDVAEDVTGYVLERSGGGVFGVVGSPFSIGGGDRDDLIVAGWPERALELRVAQGELFVEPRVAGVAVFDRVLEPDEPVAIGEGDVLVFADETFTVRQFDATAPTTKVKRGELPTRVVIEILPRGGRIVFTTSAREYEVLLADRRLDLLMALLHPPAGHAAGDWIPDDVVRAVVWPRNPGVSRPEINTLISRCRRDLVGAGLAGPRLLERSPGGGATRIALASGATVEVRG